MHKGVAQCWSSSLELNARHGKCLYSFDLDPILHEWTDCVLQSSTFTVQTDQKRLLVTKMLLVFRFCLLLTCNQQCQFKENKMFHISVIRAFWTCLTVSSYSNVLLCNQWPISLKCFEEYFENYSYFHYVCTYSIQTKAGNPCRKSIIYKLFYWQVPSDTDFVLL